MTVTLCLIYNQFPVHVLTIIILLGAIIILLLLLIIITALILHSPASHQALPLVQKFHSQGELDARLVGLNMPGA